MSVGRDRRKLRRAIGPKASDALLEMGSRTLDTQRFILMWQHGGFFRRCWSLLTGWF